MRRLITHWILNINDHKLRTHEIYSAYFVPDYLGNDIRSKNTKEFYTRDVMAR